MARLGVAEIGQIERAVDRMASRLAAGEIALGFSADERQLLGARLGIKPMGGLGTELDVSAIRAEYSPDSRSITLSGVFWQFDPPPDEPIVARFRTWVCAALAHEVCHLRQHEQEPHRFVPGGEGARASELSKAVQRSGLPDDYLAYVGCDLEREAHATQLAAELRSFGRLDEEAFMAAANDSSLLAHVRERAGGLEGEYQLELMELEKRLTNEAFEVFEAMWPPVAAAEGAEPCQR